VKNSSDNVFQGIPVGKEEAVLVNRFLAEQDYADNTRRAFIQDVQRFARWFTEANNEPFRVARVSVADVADFRNHARRNLVYAVSTVNRNLVTLRRLFVWLVEVGHIPANPVKAVKELRSQTLAPKGLERSEVRRLLREAELRRDVRAGAIFGLFVFSGCRVGDLVALELHDIVLGERSGSVTFRDGKGRKQRTAPLPLPARKALLAYLESRPPVDSDRVFIGERGPLTDKGIRGICSKYGTILGIKLHPHLLRHSMAHSSNSSVYALLASSRTHISCDTRWRTGSLKITCRLSWT
jgi:integrase/recombinase XerC